jgi:hypothetical protein
MKKIYATIVVALTTIQLSYAQWLPLTAGSGNPLTGPLDINATAYSEISTSNGDFLSIEAFNSTNTVKKPLALAPWGGNVGIGTASPHTTLTIGSTDATAFITPGGPNTHLTLQSVGTDGAIRFYTTGGSTNNVAPTESMRIAAGGNIGIGTTIPGAKLDVEGGTIRVGDGSGAYSGFSFNQTNGLTQENNNKVTLYGALQVNSTAGQNSYITGTGNVGIGTMQPDQKLTVNGAIHSKEIKVDTSISVPDYVFEESYKPIDLNSLKAYLVANHHLPEIPPAAEIEKNGLDLGEMNLKLLKKVEELTLYIIEKDKQDKEKEARIAALEKTLSKLIDDQSK